MGATACGLVAGLIDWIEGPPSDHGRPRCPTQAVVETLRFFLREGVQWRELRATGDRVCGATLRRRLSEWSAEALLHRVHAALIRMVRSGPEAAAAAWDVVIDSCSVRAKRGGELTGVWGGPNSGHGAEEKPATAAVTGPEHAPLKFHTRQSFRAFWPLEPSVLEACILWRRSGLNLDRPLQRRRLGCRDQGGAGPGGYRVAAGYCELHRFRIHPPRGIAGNTQTTRIRGRARDSSAARALCPQGTVLLL